MAYKVCMMLLYYVMYYILILYLLIIEYTPSNQAKAIIFDKTGTLTYGKPDVSRVVLYTTPTFCPYRLFLALVGKAESNSEHPLGQAITSYAKQVRYMY